MNKKVEKIIIIGAGMAGLGCAKHLYEEGVKFKIITKNIGGRVRTSPDGEVNYGAYYVTEDYTNTLPYLEKTGKVDFTNSHLHSGKKHYHLVSLKILKHFPAIIRILIDLYKFRKHLHKFKKESLIYSKEKLIESNKLFRKYYHQKAGEYIKENGMENLVKEYIEQPLWASFFIDPRKISTAIFLGALQPLIVPSYSFKMNFDKITKGFKDRIIIDSIIKVIRKKDFFELKTKLGRIYYCKKLVLATPMNITNKLIKPQKINKGINVSFYHIKGEIRKPYDVKGYNFFAVKEATAISKELNGTYLYFYTGKDKINKYFKRWEIITKDSWKPALFFIGDKYINMNPEPKIFLANDHNVPSIENAFINGIYTANKILGKAKD